MQNEAPFFSQIVFFTTFTASKTIRMPRKTTVIIALLSLFLSLASCHNKQIINEEPIKEIDSLTRLERLREKGVLVAVTNCGAINYTKKGSHPSGFEYELLDDFCTANDLKLELLVNDSFDSCFFLLDSNMVDVVAIGIGSSRAIKQRYLMTDPIMQQKSVLVQRLPKDWKHMSTANEVENQLLRSPLDLARKTIYLPKGSHEVKLLEHLSDEIGDTIYVVECDTLNSVDLVRAVSKGLIDYTVVQEYVAKMASNGLGGLDIKLSISVEQPLGWVLKKDDTDSSLLLAFNSWIAGMEQRHFNRILAKYVNKSNVFSEPKKIQSKSQLSEYDGIIKKTAKNIGWDWRLLASLIYQESHFSPELESEKGAFGLMQLMPVVMERYEIDYDSTPEEQVEAGGKLIKHLTNCLENKIVDSAERVKFVLAAYNAGLGHVYDAQRLAEKYGKEPDVWDDNVDYFILNKSKAQYYNDTCCRAGYLRGTETFRFVEEVLDRYEEYRMIYN